MCAVENGQVGWSELESRKQFFFFCFFFIEERKTVLFFLSPIQTVMGNVTTYAGASL